MGRSNILAAEFVDDGKAIAVAGVIDGRAIDGVFDRVGWGPECSRFMTQVGSVRRFDLPSAIRIEVDRADPRRRFVSIGSDRGPK